MSLSMELFIEMAYALGIGVLIGLERSMGAAKPDAGTKDGGTPGSSEEGATASSEAHAGPGDASTATEGAPSTTSAGTIDDDVSREMKEGDYMGVRTFAVLSLVGFAAALVSDSFPLVAPIALGGVTLLVIAMYFRASHLGLGITTEAAAVGACGLGMLCHTNAHAAGVLALVLTVLLTSKRFTHKVVLGMRRVELTDTLKFLVIILILLPLMPNEALDPYGAFNPYKVTFLVILISGIGYVGYFLTKLLGAQRGLGITGLVGGLTSSTAVTAAMASQAKQTPSVLSACAFATVGANATMFARVLVVVAILDMELMKQLAWSIGAMTAVAVVASVVLWIAASRKKKDGGEEASGKVDLKNPFSLGPALKFAGFFVVILLVAKLAKTYFGDSGLYAASALSGLADVDAITMSIAEQAQGGSLARDVGAIGITIAVVANSFVKSGIAWYSGGWRFGRVVGLCLLAATGVGLAVAFVA